ncbi:MAG TPA: murein biosynthesis integral membrane protein MurJ [Thermoanaerobaculia bacterium]|jgi:putative peptidoglycan lipid II flippase|nr:murein biosynthesis integral membrane protein MurJ [Thermoanaerobaculia bacterium]
MTIDPTTPEIAAKAKKRPAGFAVLVASGILLTRISGFVREKVFAHFLGNSDAAGIYRAAIRIPNILQNLFGEGVLSASFIPVYAKLLAENDEETAGRVAGIVASLLALAMAVLVLIGVLLTPWLLIVIAPGYKGEIRELTITVVRIMWPGIGLLVLSAWCLGILNSHRKFFLSYVAPVFMNIVMIATLVIFGGRTNDRGLVVIAAWGTVVGAFAQFGIQIPAVFRYAKHLRFAIDTSLAPVREVIRNFTPVVVGRGVVQLSGYIDNLLATLLGTAAVSALSYAQIVSMLPISLFGMSVAAAELPQMSGMIGTPEEVASAMRTRLARGLRQIAFFVVPTVVAFIAIGNVIVAALYQGGRFHASDTLLVWYILIGSTVGLLAVTLGRLYSSAFYALRDTKTPLRFAMIRVTLTAALGWIFAIPLRPLLIRGLQFAHVPLPVVGNGYVPLGAIALTATAGIAGWLEFLLLRHFLARRIGTVRIETAYLLKLWGSSVLAGIVGAAGNLYLVPHIPLPRIFPNIAAGILVCGGFGVVYFAATIALGVPEARATLQRFKRTR